MPREHKTRHTNNERENERKEIIHDRISLLFRIHLCNFFHFQYIQADNRIHVIQRCCGSLHSRDKSGFLYTRQSLWNQKKKKWDFKVIQNTCIWTALILPWKGVERKYTDDWAKKTMHTIKYNKKFSFGKIQHNIQWDKFTPLSATRGQLSYQHWKSEKKSPIYIISSVD